MRLHEKRYMIYILASFGKFFILPRCFVQMFYSDVSIRNFYLHRRSGENLRYFWRRIKHDVAMSRALIGLMIHSIFSRLDAFLLVVAPLLFRPYFSPECCCSSTKIAVNDIEEGHDKLHGLGREGEGLSHTLLVRLK